MYRRTGAVEYDDESYALDATQLETHIFEFAFKGLSHDDWAILASLALDDTPLEYDELRHLCVADERPSVPAKSFDRIARQLGLRTRDGEPVNAARYDSVLEALRGVCIGDGRPFATRYAFDQFVWLPPSIYAAGTQFHRVIEGLRKRCVATATSSPEASFKNRLGELYNGRRLIDRDPMDHRYSLHPLIRNFVKGRLDEDLRERFAKALEAMLEGLPSTLARLLEADRLLDPDAMQDVERERRIYGLRVEREDFGKAWATYSAITNYMTDLAAFGQVVADLARIVELGADGSVRCHLVGDRQQTVQAIAALADAHRLLDEDDEAIQLCTYATELEGETNVTDALSTRALARQSIGDWVEGDRDLATCLDRVRASKDKVQALASEAHLLRMIAHSLAALGQEGLARLALARSGRLERNGRTASRWGGGSIGFRFAGQLELLRHGESQSRVLLAERFDRAAEMLGPHIRALGRHSRGWVYAAVGEVDRGLDDLASAGTMWFNNNQVAFAAHTRRDQARCLAVADRLDDAEKRLEEAIDLMGGRAQGARSRACSLDVQATIDERRGHANTAVASSLDLLKVCANHIPRGWQPLEDAIERLRRLGRLPDPLPPELQPAEPYPWTEETINPRDGYWVDPERLPPLDWM